MTSLYPVQSSFASGEIDPALIGRTDLRAYADGARKLSNVVVTVGGGVKRRPGLRHVAEVPGRGRLALIGLDGGKRRLFVLLAARLLIFEQDVLVADMAAPWTEAQLASLAWTTHRGGLLVCHPAMPPQQATPDVENVWRILPWSFATRPGSSQGMTVVLQPYAKYAPDDATLQAASIGGGSWSFTSNRKVFQPGHVGARLRFRDVEVAITSINADGTVAFGTPQAPIDDASRTKLWEEQGFSSVAGYPAAAVVFRERLVVGGVPKMPNRRWMSKVGNPFDFDMQEGLDDEAIAFQLGNDRAHAIRGFGAGRSLEIFTAAGEWTVDGNPLSPMSVQAVPQTGIGSVADRYVPPAEVDGATVFIARSDDAVVEYVFTDVNVAYQAQDLAVRARHLVRAPVDLAFDEHRRVLFLVRGDGKLVSATIDRHAGIVAWSGHDTQGEVLAAVSTSGVTLFLVRRGDRVRIERLDDGLVLDAAKTLEAATPQTLWTGLGHLDGGKVYVIADDIPRGLRDVSGGTLILDTPARRLVVGLPFGHGVEPLPLLIDGRRKAGRYRPVQITFELHDTAGLAVDVGEGLREVPLGTAANGRFTGPQPVAARGWRRLGDGPLWRIHDARPVRFELLSVISDVKVTR